MPDEAAPASTAAVVAPKPQRAPERIKLACTCGAQIGAPPSAAGRRVKCPQCGATLHVPEAVRVAGETSSTPDAFDELMQLTTGTVVDVERPRPSAPPPPSDTYSLGAPIGGARTRFNGEDPLTRPTRPSGPPVTCRCCQQEYPAGTRLCVACGLNLKTGRPILMKDDSAVGRSYMWAESLLTWLSWLIPWGFAPVASEAFGTRKPWVVRSIAAVTVLISFWYMVAFLWNPDPPPGLANLMLWAEHPRQELEITGSFHPYQLITHTLLHGDPLHLAGNLLFLMILGSRVNALIGNALTLLLYPFLGIVAGLAHQAASGPSDPWPSLGASGAVMGLAGMYLILFPAHYVHVATWWRWGLVGGFQLNLRVFPVRGFWIVLFYIAFDVFYTVLQIDDDVAHWAHLGGFIAGVLVALGLLLTRLVNARGGDLLSVVLGPAAWGLIGKPNRPGLVLW